MTVSIPLRGNRYVNARAIGAQFPWEVVSIPLRGNRYVNCVCRVLESEYKKVSIPLRGNRYVNVYEEAHEEFQRVQEFPSPYGEIGM